MYASILPIFQEIKLNPTLWSLIVEVKRERNKDVNGPPEVNQYEPVIEDYFNIYKGLRYQMWGWDWGKEDFLEVGRVAKNIATTS
ncbi:hypothetical protein TWF718_007332 [Orbilia javanica]|uniref:Uncharacterized protein n=1 Tax=Orbilia javanica TaxID=47235 RepID=A0AAN8RD69_9PEZI